MLNKTAWYLANRLLRNQVISEEALDVYIYGFELLISFFFSTSVILIVGILTGRIFETLAFLVCFILLRSFTGGYHALTYWFCTVVTVSVFCAVLLLSHFLPVNLLAYGIMFLPCFLILLGFSPVENPNKVYSESKKRKYKLIGLILFTGLSASGAVFLNFFSSIGSSVFYTLLADIALLFPKNRRKGVERNVEAHG